MTPFCGQSLLWKHWIAVKWEIGILFLSSYYPRRNFRQTERQTLLVDFFRLWPEIENLTVRHPYYVHYVQGFFESCGSGHCYDYTIRHFAGQVRGWACLWISSRVGADTRPSIKDRGERNWKEKLELWVARPGDDAPTAPHTFNLKWIFDWSYWSQRQQELVDQSFSFLS